MVTGDIIKIYDSHYEVVAVPDETGHDYLLRDIRTKKAIYLNDSIDRTKIRIVGHRDFMGEKELEEMIREKALVEYYKRLENFLTTNEQNKEKIENIVRG